MITYLRIKNKKTDTDDYLLTKMDIKIPCQLSPAGLIRIFTCKGLPALSAELHLALVPEEVHL